MDVRIDKETAKELVGEALLGALTAEKRDILIQGALAHLIGGRDSHDKLSPLERIWRDAIERIAREQAAAALSTNEVVKAEVDKFIADGLKHLFEKPEVRQKAVERIADAVVTAMFGSRY